MTGYTRGELLAAHGQFINSEDNLTADGGTGIRDSGTLSTLRADRGEEPPVVVKIGGAKAIDPKGAIFDVAHLAANSIDVAVVHGGLTAVDETLEEFGEEPTHIESSSGVSGRFTDERAMEIFPTVMPGKLSTDLAALSREAGVDALGLSGVDGGLLTRPRKLAVRVVGNGKKRTKHDNHSGKITLMNTTSLEILPDGGYTPIATIPTLADDGVPANADTDHAIATVVGALGMKPIVLTDVKGVYVDPDDESTLIEAANMPEEFSALELAAEGFMTKEVMVVKEAFDGGAAEVVVIDANLSNPIVTALNGGSTHVTPGALVEVEGAEQ